MNRTTSGRLCVWRGVGSDDVTEWAWPIDRDDVMMRLWQAPCVCVRDLAAPRPPSKNVSMTMMMMMVCR